jgi:hypothetical protein
MVGSIYGAARAVMTITQVPIPGNSVRGSKERTIRGG